MSLPTPPGPPPAVPEPAPITQPRPCPCPQFSPTSRLDARANGDIKTEGRRHRKLTHSRSRIAGPILRSPHGLSRPILSVPLAPFAKVGSRTTNAIKSNGCAVLGNGLDLLVHFRLNTVDTAYKRVYPRISRCYKHHRKVVGSARRRLNHAMERGIPPQAQDRGRSTQPAALRSAGVGPARQLDPATLDRCHDPARAPATGRRSDIDVDARRRPLHAP